MGKLMAAFQAFFQEHSAHWLEHTIAKGLDQTRTYMDTCGTADGHLVIFNRDPDVPWEDKIFQRTDTCRKIPIHIWGM